MIFYEKLLDSTEMIINETELLWKYRTLWR